MCQKLIICRYIKYRNYFTPCTVDRDYAYFIETKRKIKKGDYICIAENKGNDNGVCISIVRVMNVVNNYKNNVEEGNTLIASCENSPCNKIFVGKVTQKLKQRFKENE